MLTFVRSLLQSSERKREANRDLLEFENNFLDHEVVEEELEEKDKINLSCMKNIIENVNKQPEPAAECVTNSKLAGMLCSARKGIVTSIAGENGAIDNYICFDAQAGGSLFQDLHVGCKIEYLSYNKENDDYVKVVKILKILEHNWEDAGEKKLQDAVDALKNEKPTYFNTHLRTVLGIIKRRHQSSIEVDTGTELVDVELDNVDLNFIPKEGDRVSMECNVQVDEKYVNKQGEILQVLKVSPSRIEHGERCTIQRVYEKFAALAEDAYVLKEDLPKGTDLHLGDIVKVDLIEVKHEKYSRRAIKCALLEKNFGLLKSSVPAHNNNNNNNNQAVALIGEDRAILTELWQKKHVTIKVQNNLNRLLRLVKIEVLAGKDSQIHLVEPLDSVDIVNGGEIWFKFNVLAKNYGEFTESIVLHFDRFRMRRPFTIIACETPSEAVEAERRLVASATLSNSGRNALQRSRFYANQVWSNKADVVPGECIATKRRFVAVRLGYYEVPEKLRSMYLTIERRPEMLDSIESVYPCLSEELNVENYVQRFGLFLHLEEIDYFISFRNYDRDRAHFQRDGEFLTLHIENLAERRPSLVVGDVIRAINPWPEGTAKDNKTFEGIVHKVMFDRVLLKFNASFQEKYNGEDYRLEFYFSRFGFRKQHFAIARVVALQGEQFLFPSRVTKRPYPQLSVNLKDGNMYLYDTKLNWYNKTLNVIQKRAVFNILRGEIENMPYIIFGPPGTGKTVTLVETILQLLGNLPGARLLVGTPSNSSADLITKRIIDSNALQPGDFIRLVSQNQIEKDLIPPELMAYCATVDIGSVGTCCDTMVVTESGLKLRCQMKFLGRHRVTISTCTTLGNFLQMGFPIGHFTHVLIDEAGQCTETESIIPVVMLARTRSQVVLAGDPHQLQAIVINRYAGERGFQVSFLERLLNRLPYRKDLQRYPDYSGYNPCVLTKLLYNYRALPSIMSIYSKLFYDDELIPMVSDTESREARILADVQRVFDANNDTPITHGTFFHGVMGENMQEPDSPSWFNSQEAREVFITTIALYRLNVHPDQIGILTPYVKQVKKLRTMFITADVAMPKIGSVEEFQGQERDIMLISTVRSTESVLRNDSRLCLGFVHCKKRMNVAISRARCLMVIFGNPHLLAVDDCWRQLILFCANNNAYFGCEIPDSIYPFETEELDEKFPDTFNCVP